MILKQDIFNPYTLNIFADASVLKTGIMKADGKEHMITAPGCVAVITNEDGSTQIIDASCYKEPGTNNSGEIKAIRLGIMMVLKHRSRFNTINLFSDSGICINGLRSWIYGWINRQNSGILYSSTGDEVSNQYTFRAIIDDIVKNNIILNLYHQRGHIDSPSKFAKARNDFKKFNNIKDEVEESIIKEISFYNEFVDSMTKGCLREYYNDPLFKGDSKEYFSRQNQQSERALEYKPIDRQKVYKYGKLIGGK